MTFEKALTATPDNSGLSDGSGGKTGAIAADSGADVGKTFVPTQIVVKSYPDGVDTIWHGWKLGFGASSGVAVFILLAAIIHKVLGLIGGAS